jgi:hypothetical protein
MPETQVKVVKDGEGGWAIYVSQEWVADFSSEAVALYFTKLLETDSLLRYLVLGKRSLER